VTLTTGYERSLLERIAELERRNAEWEALYTKAVADLTKALDRASAYRATAAAQQEIIEKRSGVERRDHNEITSAISRQAKAGDLGRCGKDRRKSWPR
jgi:hypothetical protein